MVQGEDPGGAGEVTDAELIESYRNGDTSAAATLYVRHRESVMRLSHRFVPPGAVEEVTSETFTKVFETISRGKGPKDNFLPYTFAALRSVSTDWRRDRAKYNTVDEIDDLEIETAPAADRELEEGDAEIMAAFQQLPERWQKVLWLRTVQESSVQDIARVENVSAPAVSVLYQRAREGLRKKYLEQLSIVSARGACRDYSKSLAQSSFASLSGRRQNQLEAHVQGCERCQETREQLDHLVQRFSKTAAMGILPAGLGVSALSVNLSRSAAAAALLGAGAATWITAAVITLLVGTGGVLGVLAAINSSESQGLAIDTGSGQCELDVRDRDSGAGVELATKNTGEKACFVTLLRDGAVIDGPSEVRKEQVLVTARAGRYEIVMAANGEEKRLAYTVEP
ncbi:sigma-70 family RNA polymerase sigma factor [Leucobacter viscericola]|uniref:Sigma-70 family RNA polymerase sigma factor n=1 Tax=Leucobacter viscericola TaxID=2714935 RepID=A0A6G7XHQ5_9MICO|nr:sigma-70 family RNA polymerase sigma factor [Leucobacter viscericola]QIK64042.1 sigma-70 family RNA polymerase sigma factor [Leucobacter viscericola]